MQNSNGRDENDEKDCDDVLGLIQRYLRKFEDDPEQRQQFIGGLAQLLAAVKYSDGNGDQSLRPSAGSPPSAFTGRGSMDRHSACDTRARDRRAYDCALARDAAQRSIHHRDFLRRFPDAAKISVRG
jgi:hypothetical protein